MNDLLFAYGFVLFAKSEYCFVHWKSDKKYGTLKGQDHKHRLSKYQYEDTTSILNTRPVGFNY